MSLAELSKVTQVLQHLLEDGIKAFGIIAEDATAPIDLVPPDAINANKDTLSLYLYHVREDESARNMPSSTDTSLGVAYTPLGLRLYYQLTAHPGTTGDGDTETIENLFGGALKTLHDYPILNPSTRVRGSDKLLFDREGFAIEVERLDISLLNIPVEEAANYWMAGSEPRRLSAHLEVSVVFLEAEEPTTMSMPVLEPPNVFVEAGLGVVLEASSSIHLIDAPGRAPRRVELTPARPAIGESFLLRGQGWGASPVHTRLYDQRRDKPLELDHTHENSSARRTTRLEIALPSQDDTGEPVIPGIYGVTVAKVGARESNRAVIMVQPAVEVTDVKSGEQTFSLAGGPFADPGGELELNVQVYVGEEKLEQSDANQPEEDTFVVGQTQIDVKLSDWPSDGEVLGIRVIVDDADSLPVWLEGGT